MNETAPETATRATETGDDPIPRYAQLDVWMALGEHPGKFDRWRNDLTFAEAWAQLMHRLRVMGDERSADLPDRLREAGWVDPEEAARLRGEVDRLANVIMAIPGEPSSEGSVFDCAIRLITEAQTRYASSGAWAEAGRLAAERDALLPVVEAARALILRTEEAKLSQAELSGLLLTLHAAVDALDSGSGTEEG